MSTIRNGQSFPIMTQLVSELARAAQQNQQPARETSAGGSTVSNPFLLPSNTVSQNNQSRSNDQSAQMPSMMAVMMTLLTLLMQIMIEGAQNARNGGNNGGGFFGFVFGVFGGNGGGAGTTSLGSKSGGAVDPLALDTDGNGTVDMTSKDDGVMFDMDGDGVKEKTAWTKANGDNTDAWLAMDRNGNGQIDNGKELFGNQNGKANGFEELRKFDANGDGVIDAKDPVYNQLRTWQDKNHDGVSQPDELKTLQQAGIQNINLNYKNSAQQDAFGNQFRQQSAFIRTDAGAQQVASNQGISVDAARTGKALDIWS